jgi:hypothetical protein
MSNLIFSKRRTPGVLFFLSMLMLIWITMIAHEAVHWLTGQALGYDMFMQLTRAGYVADFANPGPLDLALVSISGPVFTWSLGAVGVWLAVSRKSFLGYELIVVAFAQRFLALTVGTVAGVNNDEARVSLILGLPFWVLPTIVCLILFAGVVIAARATRASILTHVLSYGVISIAFTAIIFADGTGPGGDGCGLLSGFLPDRYGCAV